MIGYPYGHFGGGPDVGALVEVKHRGREDACHIAEEGAQKHENNSISRITSTNFMS